MNRVRVGVLASGSGTNLQALLDATASTEHPAEVAVVASDRPHAMALQRAADAGVPTAIVRKRDFPDRERFDRHMVDVLHEHRCEWVCLAGFMRLITPFFLEAFEGRVVNIHPSLLPAFPGLHAQRQAHQAGVRIAGCTVHFVDNGVDTGPIIAQGAVPVREDDTPEQLSARILQMEHRVYPMVLRWLGEGRIQLQGRTAVVALRDKERRCLMGEG